MNIGFIGLGKLGLPCALAINDKGHNVWGYDIDENVKNILQSKTIPYIENGAEELLQNHSIIFDTIGSVVNNSDIIFVPIQTPHEYIYEGCTRIPEQRDDFNYEALKLGIQTLSDEIKRQVNNKIVIIISTVLPGTIEREILPIIEDNDKFKLCYNPFFIAMGTTINDFLNPEFVLFGTDSDNVREVVKDFYSTIHSKPFYETSIKNAELIKVSYNTFIGMKIVFANTIMEMCHKTGADVDEVMGGLKIANDRLISPKYLSGGMGDGGGCHPRDNIAMSWLSNKVGLSYNFFDDIMMGREKQTEFLTELILQHPRPYYILGKTFKENTNLVLGSASILLCNILKEKNITFETWDPHVDKIVPEFKKGTYFVATKHNEFKDFKFPSESVVIDVWRYLTITDSTIKHVKVGKNNICH
jgi:UDPglucose 6-dehydrogenase